VEIPQDLLNPGLHARPPVTFVENDRGERLARPAGIVIDDNVMVPIVTTDVITP
jgi:hypothetical protein